MNKLDLIQIDRIIEMAWEDRTPFDAIEATYGLNQNQVEDLMRDNLKKNSYTLRRITPTLIPSMAKSSVRVSTSMGS